MLAGLHKAIRLRSIGRLLIEETDCHILSSLRGEYSLPFRLVESGVTYYC